MVLMTIIIANFLFFIENIVQNTDYYKFIYKYTNIF